MKLHQNKTFYYLFALFVFLSLVITFMVAIYKTYRQTEKDLNNQFYTLSYESSQVLETNSKILNNLVKRIESDLKTYANNRSKFVSQDEYLQSIFLPLTEGLFEYTETFIILTNNDYKIIASSGKNNSIYKNNVSLKDRDYMQNISHSQLIQIGDSITGALSKSWSIPIAKAITNKKGEFVGAIVISIPLCKFSKSISNSNINLLSLDLKKSDLLIDSSHIHSIISLDIIIKSIFIKDFEIPIYGFLDNIDRIGCFVINSHHIRKFFLEEYFSYSIIILLLCGFIFICWYSLKKGVLDPLIKISNNLLDATSEFTKLIPEYKIQTNMDTLNSDGLQELSYYNDSLKQIECFVLSNQIVINALVHQKNIIENKEKQLSLLQNNFVSCMKSLQESGICLSEKIDDIILHNKNNINIRKEARSKILINTLEEIYNYSIKHRKRIAELNEIIDIAWDIVQTSKVEVDIKELLLSIFSINEFNGLTFNKNIANPKNNKILKKKFYFKAIENVLKHILLAFTDDYNNKINITFGNNQGRLYIEVSCSRINHGNDESVNFIDNTKLQIALEKARLFALLDEGIITLYNRAGKIIISVMYLL